MSPCCSQRKITTDAVRFISLVRYTHSLKIRPLTLTFTSEVKLKVSIMFAVISYPWCDFSDSKNRQNAQDL